MSLRTVYVVVFTHRCLFYSSPYRTGVSFTLLLTAPVSLLLRTGVSSLTHRCLFSYAPGFT